MNRASTAVLYRDFWAERLAVNARQAIFHQWDQLEASGCIQNFRLATGEGEGMRIGWFFADSDAYKWLEAAARILPASPDPRLAALVDGFIALLGRAQMADGYLFTYNQIYFPGTRWQNLQIEHELYCHGHLIEAGVSHFESTGRDDLLAIARRAADRIVADFRGQGPAFTPGHEEIEIALLRLHQVTPGDTIYLEMAHQFIERRGRTPAFGLSLFVQNYRVGRRGRLVRRRQQEYRVCHPGYQPPQLPPGNQAPRPFNATLRWYANALSGKYLQQHAPIRKQTTPVGHAVRFAYLETAAAMLARESGDRTLLPTLEQAWERMVTRRMYVTGGIGSLPGLEGFGNDYELDPEYAYAETCAALASLFWNWEMAQLTGEAKYSDLFEWQLYNAAAAGMGLAGDSYLYNNPLASHGKVVRRPWFAVPCCPSNLSRTWADLGRYIFSSGLESLSVHQYIGARHSTVTIPLPNSAVRASLTLESDLPWDGAARLKIQPASATAGYYPDEPVAWTLQLRQPSWASGMHVLRNGEPITSAVGSQLEEGPTASGYDPRTAVFLPVHRSWLSGGEEEVEIRFEMPIRLLRAHPQVKGHRGKVAVTRGPLVYCLESIDHPVTDIFNAVLDPASLTPVFDKDILGGIVKLHGQTKDGALLTFIPYYLWGNRGPSQMTVWANT